MRVVIAVALVATVPQHLCAPIGQALSLDHIVKGLAAGLAELSTPDAVEIRKRDAGQLASRSSSM